MQRKSWERARHECFLVIKAAADDVGTRPLATPFASSDIGVAADGRPRVTVWNLGHKEAHGVVIEFYVVPAGLPVNAENAQLIGLGNPAIIPPGQSIGITCNQVWRRMSHADVLLVTASHEELDAVKLPFDAVRDRHVGQMNYPWAGSFTGFIGSDELKVQLEVKPSNQGLFKVKLFEEVAGRMPSFPKCDRIMKPNKNTLRWMEVEQNQKVIYDLVMQENNRLSFLATSRPMDQPNAPAVQVTGTMERD